MRPLQRILPTLTCSAAALVLSGCATGLPRVRQEAFKERSSPPVVYLVAPQIETSSGFAFNSREFLRPLIQKASRNMTEEVKLELSNKGYRVGGGELIDTETLPRDAKEERFRDVVYESYGELGLMSSVLLQNLSKEKNDPLDYRLGRRAAELAQTLNPQPDWLFFHESWAALIGIVPASEKTTMGVLLGAGLSPPGYDCIVQRAAMVDAKTGEVLWFHTTFEMAQSLLFPASRAGTVKRLLAGLPRPGQTSDDPKEKSP